MGSSACNTSLLTGGKLLHFVMETFFIYPLFFLKIYNQIKDFTNQIFVTSSLWYSIYRQQVLVGKKTKRGQIIHFPYSLSLLLFTYTCLLQFVPTAL